jgi:transcriptional regulator with XRE-family HTH domain
VDEHFMAGQKTDQRDVYVGQRIAEQRRKASLTQRRVAQSFGMSAAQLQKYEKGTNRISAVHLDIFSRMTGVPMDYFFTGMPRNDDFVAPGFSEREQSALSDGGLKGLAEVVGRHITENFSEEARRDVADAIRALETKLGG